MELSKEQLLENAVKNTPHVTVNIPSGGNFYEKGSTLAKGSFRMRFLTGEDEEILTSPTFIRNNQTFNVLLKKIILEPNFDAKALVNSDKSYLVLSSRISL